jgi:RNA polymerase sigma-70 factor (ECF subfamily)
MEATFQEMLAKARLGDNQCICALTEEVLPRLKSYLLRITLDEELTNDVVQETLMRMVEALGNLRNIERFWPWLFRIANNLVKDAYCKRAQRKEVSLSAAMLDFVDARSEVPNTLPENIKEVIGRGIASLPLQQRSVVSLHCFEGMSYAGSPKNVGCNATTARVAFFRAKQSLGKHLKRNGISKTMLMSALSIFGLMTAVCKAAVPEAVLIQSALLDISLWTRS